MRLGWLLLLLSCKTPCRASTGLEFAGFVGAKVPSWMCEEFKRAHDKALINFEHVKDSRFRGIYLGGFRVWVKDSYRFTAYNSQGPSGGNTVCENGTIWVNNEAPLAGPLVHEMAHAIQKCAPQAEMGPQDVDAYHAGWYSRGIWSALAQTQEVQPGIVAP